MVINHRQNESNPISLSKIFSALIIILADNYWLGLNKDKSFEDVITLLNFLGKFLPCQSYSSLFVLVHRSYFTFGATDGTKSQKQREFRTLINYQHILPSILSVQTKYRIVQSVTIRVSSNSEKAQTMHVYQHSLP